MMSLVDVLQTCFQKSSRSRDKPGARWLTRRSLAMHGRLLYRSAINSAIRWHSTVTIEKTASNDNYRLRLVEERYCNDLSSPCLPSVLDALEEETIRDFRNAHMLISKTHGKLMHSLIRLLRPRNILEIGTFTGYSTIAMASALEPTAELLTLELDERPLSVAQRYTTLANLQGIVKFRQGLAMDSLSSLTKDYPQLKFDVIFLDADKRGYKTYYDWIMDKDMLSDRGVILVDNVLFFGQVHREAGYEDPQPSEVSKRIKNTALTVHKFNQHVLSDPRVQVVMLPMFDGLSVIQKKKSVNTVVNKPKA